ncbi:A disintegrin and metalloproteinase with thrombospondin motifs 17 isoform X1 [Lates japonicus]
MDLLHARCRLERAFRDICIIALTETWLDESVLDEEVGLDNFTIIRSDRTTNSGKTRGGGVCLYINDRWCNNIKAHHKASTPDLELLTVSLRPYYLPREFPAVVVSCVYIPPDANYNKAAEMLAGEANSMLARYPGAPVFIMGDYNNCRLDRTLPSFQQYVDIPTRRENVLDLCYGNIANAFRARSYPPLGLADHNMICLLPVYRQELKRIKPQIYSAPQWTEDAIAQLQGSLACTDWEIFEGDLDHRVSTVTDYINFCITTTIPVKKNNKIP